MMNDSLSRSWWIPALRGLVAVAFGLLALFWPGLTLVSLIGLFALYALIGGTVSLLGAFNNRNTDEWGLLLLLGLVSICAGLIAMVHPALTILVLTLVIGAHALICGVLEIALALRMRKTIRNEGLLIASAAASIAFGILVFLFPEAGALTIVWMISSYAFISGIFLLLLALRLRLQLKKGVPPIERRVLSDRRMSSAH